MTRSEAGEIHARLREIGGEMILLGGRLALGRRASSDTMFAAGEAAGLLRKVAALLGRDMDDAAFPETPL